MNVYIDLTGNLIIAVQFNNRAERRGKSVHLTNRLPQHSSAWLGGTANQSMHNLLKIQMCVFQ